MTPALLPKKTPKPKVYRSRLRGNWYYRELAANGFVHASERRRRAAAHS
jgi:hypothetical protein